MSERARKFQDFTKEKAPAAIPAPGLVLATNVGTSSDTDNKVSIADLLSSQIVPAIAIFCGRASSLLGSLPATTAVEQRVEKTMALSSADNHDPWCGIRPQQD